MQQLAEVLTKPHSFPLQMNEPALLNTCHSVQVSRILKWRVARTYQADVLLKVCFVLLL